jgi:hypothetical protein
MANTIRGNAVLPYPNKGTINRQGVSEYFHRATTSTSGTIASQDDITVSGMTATKTATETGRYTLTLACPYKRLLWVEAKIMGADDAAYGAVTVGLMSILRDNDVDGGAADGTVEVQFIGSNAGWADAEVADGAIIFFRVCVSQGV